MNRTAFALLPALWLVTLPLGAAELPIFDAHVHYSHDAVERTPPKAAAAILRKAGLKNALVSSSGDEGTQRLLAEAPEIVIPSLRPYRQRGELSSWVRDESVVGFVEDLLRRHRYAVIGEFHVSGADADLPVPGKLVALAKQHKLVLHAHSDSDAIDRLFRHDPQARILWAHAGFESPAKLAEMLRKHRNLWCDLSIRTEHGDGGKVPDEWRKLFTEFPDRFMVGTDTYTPTRWDYLVEHARWSRAWLADLPPELAERIAWRNAEALFAHWKANSAK